MIEIITIALAVVTTFWVGYIAGNYSRHPLHAEQVEAFIKKNHPDTWAAYHQGVDQGYEQGLRDATETYRHEPT